MQRRFLRDYGRHIEQLARVAVITREHARRKPGAHMTAPLTVEDVLASTELDSHRRFGDDGLLERIRRRPDFGLLQTILLRSLKQAVYSPSNVGHFGLAFAAYVHFTSPIRRYVDLLVHRSLVSVFNLGAGELPKGEAAEFGKIGEVISALERRAMEAEAHRVRRNRRR